jgi:hypothetical protein
VAIGVPRPCRCRRRTSDRATSSPHRSADARAMASAGDCADDRAGSGPDQATAECALSRIVRVRGGRSSQQQSSKDWTRNSGPIAHMLVHQLRVALATLLRSAIRSNGVLCGSTFEFPQHRNAGCVLVVPASSGANVRSPARASRPNVRDCRLAPVPARTGTYCRDKQPIRARASPGVGAPPAHSRRRSGTLQTSASAARADRSRRASRATIGRV